MYNAVGERMLNLVAKSAETLAIYSDNKLKYVFSVLTVFLQINVVYAYGKSMPFPDQLFQTKVDFDY